MKTLELDDDSYVLLLVASKLTGLTPGAMIRKILQEIAGSESLGYSPSSGAVDRTRPAGKAQTAQEPRISLNRDPSPSAIRHVMGEARQGTGSTKIGKNLKSQLIETHLSQFFAEGWSLRWLGGIAYFVRDGDIVWIHAANPCSGKNFYWISLDKEKYNSMIANAKSFKLVLIGLDSIGGVRAVWQSTKGTFDNFDAFIQNPSSGKERLNFTVDFEGAEPGKLIAYGDQGRVDITTLSPFR